MPKHWLPSKAYFERKLSLVETFYQAEPLTTVTNISQADANKLQTLQFESASATFKIQKKEFGVPLPRTSEDLWTRFRVMASCWIMAKMRYQANPLLQSVELEHFTRYVNFLFGPKGWMLVSLGPDKVPISCPAIDHVMAYDAGLRESLAKQLNDGVPFQTALEAALADSDLRSTYFTTSVGIDAGKPECMALTAPGIAEAYPELGRRGTKREREYIDGSTAGTPAPCGAAATGTVKSAAALKRQKKNENKKANAAAAKAESAPDAKAAARASAAANKRVEPKGPRKSARRARPRAARRLEHRRPRLASYG